MGFKPGVVISGEKPGYLDVIKDNQYILSLFPTTASAAGIAGVMQYLSDNLDKKTLKKVVKTGNGVEIYGSKSILEPIANTVTKAFADISSEMRLNMYVLITVLVVIAAFYFLILKKYI